jgi:glyoxylase-like metal-dependent hydrolase (beta-lactamase superfamily II)
MDPFTVTQPLPNVYHIRDISNVCFTLVLGERNSLLWDTGAGLYDVSACVAPYVRGWLRVVLSHGHYDHACGQHYFRESFIHPDDLRLCRRCVGRANRTQVLKRIRQRVTLQDGYDAERFLSGTPETVKPLQDFTMDLGDLEVQFMQTPGHTAGSMVAWVPARKLLLTGDMWNPHTWLFFRESQSLSAYTQTMRRLRDLQAEHVMCSHDQSLNRMDRLRAFIDGLNERTFAAAEPCVIPPYTHIHTYRCHPEPDSTLVFNGDKRI